MQKQTRFGRTCLWHRMLGEMRADAASHLLRQPISFELFLFLYLVCTLLLQKINIYRKNVHLIDINLVIFTIMILSRRLAWCTLQELQAHWNPKSSNGSLNFKRWMVVACTLYLLVIVWSVVRLIQQTSLFNLTFLLYPWSNICCPSILHHTCIVTLTAVIFPGQYKVVQYPRPI